MLNYFSPQT
uniref:Uncharacterized protein n=1 Tax=Anguilla anguilla TaxID=7936 RepID=A0A0E9V404_ANGAN